MKRLSVPVRDLQFRSVLADIKKLANELKWSNDKVCEYLQARRGVRSFVGMTYGQILEFREDLEEYTLLPF